MAEKRFEYRYATEEELEELKQREFSGWMLTYVSAGMTRGETFDDWIREMVRGADYVVKPYPRFCTRGYAFTTQKMRCSSTTYDAGVFSASGDDVYYGNIHEIMEIKYPGIVGLRCTVFYCDWYDNTPDRGVRTDAFGDPRARWSRRIRRSNRRERVQSPTRILSLTPSFIICHGLNETVTDFKLHRLGHNDDFKVIRQP
ncbi:hypothetical protein F2Q69_00031406 [Brassica cretica]|uniref:DUF4216 domain-containing protein n=1 Tax=Brassica cretica TaxID=69181 RepID=A0A8S9S405_BRACR|nr:hypothetical protein F2Q69_00031406 [Brassica cretica]